MIAQDEKYKSEPVPLSLEHKGKLHVGLARPLATSCREGACYEFDVWLDEVHAGTIYKGQEKTWRLQNCEDQEFADKIGEQIAQWYDEY